MSEPGHNIRAVARRTGLSAHVIRVWEKRYNAVTPDRTPTNRRLYSTEEIERLSLLRDLSRAGHSISTIAGLPTGKLRDLAAELRKNLPSIAPAAPEGILDECLSAVKQLDSRALDSALARGSVEFGAQGLLQKVIAPLAHSIGELWRDGTITAAHEHFATGVIRIFLGHASKSFAGTDDAPSLIVATPSAQLHELGALLAAAAAANLGWRVTYLGASLPAAEIAGAARQNQARAVALSLVYPEDDSRIADELLRLRELLPQEIPIIVGGRAALSYSRAIEKSGGILVDDLNHLCATLDGLRKISKAVSP